MAPGLGCRCAWWPRCCHLPLPQALCAPVARWASPPVILSLSCSPGREGSTLGSTLGCREMSSELCQPLAQTVPTPRDPTRGRTQLEGGGLGADTPFHLKPSSPPQSHLQHAPGTARPGGGHLRDVPKGCPRSPQHLVPCPPLGTRCSSQQRVLPQRRQGQDGQGFPGTEPAPRTPGRKRLCRLGKAARSCREVTGSPRGRARRRGWGSPAARHGTAQPGTARHGPGAPPGAARALLRVMFSFPPIFGAFPASKCQAHKERHCERKMERGCLPASLRKCRLTLHQGSLCKRGTRLTTGGLCWPATAAARRSIPFSFPLSCCFHGLGYSLSRRPRAQGAPHCAAATAALGRPRGCRGSCPCPALPLLFQLPGTNLGEKEGWWQRRSRV